MNGPDSQALSHLVLFDIDGTMLSSGGSGQAAMEIVLRDHFGIATLTGNIHTAGRTDRAIVSEMFQSYGIDLTEANWNNFCQQYFAQLPLSLGQHPNIILPGVVDLLEQLSSNPSVGMGLITGNFEHGAHIKLTHFGLRKYFAEGGFGDHHADRNDVAKLALERMVKHLGQEFVAERVLVVGDTPADIHCARSIGARVCAVSTGIYTESELLVHEPDYLLSDLSHWSHHIQIGQAL
jgi:phosphoglycolate phosphatase